ncbi:hypothetical protein AB0953_27245 [Streptomyces sp. NPDC046866]|uniref:hypothetical protein n=1 Tax=Streptomyces sp. NPDC046866 TaxID=3154921 RepID=UPI003454C8CA
MAATAFLLIGLPDGTWIERLRTSRVLITADLARAPPFRHRLAERAAPADPWRRLPRANAAVVTLRAVANIAGRRAAGALVATPAAPFALSCSAAPGPRS